MQSIPQQGGDAQGASPAKNHLPSPVGLRADLRTHGDALRLRASEKYAERCERCVARFLWYTGALTPTDITAEVVEAFLVRQYKSGAAASTVQSACAAVSQFCQHLVLVGKLRQNPCAGLRLARREERVPLWLTDEEIDDVLSIANDNGCWPEVALGLGTGLRLSELIRLEWRDIDTANKTLLVRKAKNRHPRTVPLGSVALQAIERQRPISGHFAYVFPGRHRPGGVGWVYADKIRTRQWWMLQAAAFREAVPKFSLAGKRTGRGWHMFRHTYASRLAQKGVSIFKISKWLGHRDVRMTMIYAHLSPGFDSDVDKAW